jgi:hypothetical protein
MCLPYLPAGNIRNIAGDYQKVFAVAGKFLPGITIRTCVTYTGNVDQEQPVGYA